MQQCNPPHSSYVAMLSRRLAALATTTLHLTSTTTLGGSSALSLRAIGVSAFAASPSLATSQSRSAVPAATATSRAMSSSTACSSSSSTSPLEVVQFPCLDDNYGYLLHDATTGQTAAVDTPCAATIEQELSKRGWKLTHILNTHHHYDHTGGNLDLTKGINSDVTIVGPANEQDRIPGIDVAVGDGDAVPFGSGSGAKVMDVGGHTLGHVAYYFPEAQKVFCGDALFALGCGRMFEGTPGQFWKSLRSLRDLPAETAVYCAHEYTASNAKFALSVEPGNEELMARAKKIMEMRERGEPTVPSTIGEEKRTNPFVRVDISEEIRKNVGVTSDDTDDDAFAKVRSAKDNFRG